MVEIRKINWLEADEGQRARIEKRYREQVDGLVAELEKLFPTREIVSAEVKGNFKDRLSACARELGYKSWKDFAHTCGFGVDGAACGVDALEVRDCVLRAVGKKADDMLDKIAAWYPDGDIGTLKKDHEKSVDNLSKYAQNLGYESWRELLADCGYDTSMLIGPKGGRPVSNDYEALIAELLARYEGRAKPTSMKQLGEENSDLKGKLKSFSNGAVKEYGDTGANILIARGVIGGGLAKNELSEEEVEKLLADIATRYEGRVRESSLSAFEEANPDYKASSVSVKRYIRARGTTAKRYLEEHELISRVAGEGSIPRPIGEVVEAFSRHIGAVSPSELRSLAPSGAQWYEFDSSVGGNVDYGSAQAHEMLRVGDSVELVVNEYGQVAATFCGKDLGLLNRDHQDSYRLVSRISYPADNGVFGERVRAVVTGLREAPKNQRR